MHHQCARMSNFSVLPEGCISQILSMTSPRYVCRSSAISSLFNAAADSDSVWEKFLPSDYQKIISRSASPPVGFSSMTKKQLYFSLCDSPLLLDGGKLSFGLDRESGKKCYTLPAQELKMDLKTNKAAWRWIMLPESRFSVVAHLQRVWWLNIWGRINTSMLSTNTNYAAYLIFKIADRHFGLESLPVKSSVEFVNELEDGYQDHMSSKNFFPEGTLTSQQRVQNGWLPQMRRDGWMEVELGEFYNNEGDEGEVEMRLKEVRVLKCGLIVEGIEVRPKAHVAVPFCSCTGVPQSCYKWGGGGWQSACCTVTMSVYPLPLIPNKRHARVGGRKMRGTVFTKLLTRLRAEGHDLSIPLDLKDYWAKHGSRSGI